MKTPYNVIYEYLKSIECVLLYPTLESYPDFRTKTQKIKYKCKNGHIVEVLWHSIRKNGCRCMECFKLRKRIPYQEIVTEFKKRGYDVISPTEDEYSAAYKQKIRYRCDNNHEHTIRYQDFIRGHGCPECAGLLRHKYEDVKKSFEEVGYTLLSKDYINNKQKLKYRCSMNHEHDVRYDDWQKGVRCGVCDQSKISNQEIEISDFIKSLGVDVINNDRSLISPLELDIVIPDKKIAIEYCGLYWHTEGQGKDKNYHLNKLLQCQSKGYRLITIFEDEWANKKDIVKSRLKHILGFYDRVVYARKCEVSPITAKEAKDFINEHHIQGYVSCNIKLGLFYDTELVAVMTFAKGSISKGVSTVSKVFELSRFCSACKVIGGAGKLMKHFQRNYEFDEVFTFADLRWSVGGLYKAIGFEYMYDSKPNYWYIDKPLHRTHRFGYRKNVLKDKLKTFDPSITEYQNMINNGVDRVWDCGNMKFTIKQE